MFPPPQIRLKFLNYGAENIFYKIINQQIGLFYLRLTRVIFDLRMTINQ